MVETMKRTIEISPSWDKRSADPSKNYGIHNAEIGFYLIGELGAIQFKAYTGWFLPHLKAQKESISGLYDYPSGIDIGYHARTPQFEGQNPIADDCPIIGGKCYYDGSSLNAEPIGKTLVAEGSEAVWKILEEHYIKQFGELR